MIKILLTCIKAERTGDWNLHLQPVQAMMPYLPPPDTTFTPRVHEYVWKKWYSLSLEAETAVIGEDTDLLILLIYHATNESKKIYFYSESKQNARNINVWDIKLQSLPKVLEHLHYFLTRRAISPSPPSEQC